jgi:predicted transcriptional regulator YdeE
MDFATIFLEQFFVIGIAVRTTNQNGRSQKDIGELWQRFFQQNVPSQIPGKVNDNIYCIYTDYESDANGAYTTILGCKVKTLNNVPDGLVGKTIGPSTYRLYKSSGKLPDCVLATWGEIWQTSINRHYSSDFDVYGPNMQDPNNAGVETYLSVL